MYVLYVILFFSVTAKNKSKTNKTINLSKSRNHTDKTILLICTTNEL